MKTARSVKVEDGAKQGQPASLGFNVASQMTGQTGVGEDDRMIFLANMLRAFWNYLREASGENDYAHYRTRISAEGRRPVTKREFYDQRQQEKYSRPTRCC